MEIVVLFWLLWIFLGYKMAKERNRDPALGALAGFLFGPFALIYYAMAGKKAK